MPSKKPRRLSTYLIKDYLARHVDHHILWRMAHRYDKRVSELRTRKYLAEVICLHMDSVQHILRCKTLPKSYLKKFCTVKQIRATHSDTRVTLVQKITNYVRRSCC